MRNQQIILSNKFIAERTSSSKKVRKNNRQMWAYSNSKMLDKFGNAEREKCRIDNKFCLLSIKSDRVAEWLRRWTANPIRFPCVSSNPISVGILLGTDRNYKHDEIKATHFVTNSLSRKHPVRKKCEINWRRWAHLNSKMLDKFGNAKKKRSAEQTAIFGFYQ